MPCLLSDGLSKRKKPDVPSPAGPARVTAAVVAVEIAAAVTAAIHRMPGLKSHNAVHACVIRFTTLGSAKHEEVAICPAKE